MRPPSSRTSRRSRIRRVAVTLLLACGVSACATQGPRHPSDPLESVNRAVYKFNDIGDRYAFKPVAQAYAAVLPQFVRTGVHNFFSNLDDVVVVTNDLLQGKGTNASRDGVRLMANTVFGGLGLVDVASMRGITKRVEDFGQTMAVWGVPSGPYLVLPFLGPSTVRDGAGRYVDSYIDPVWQITDVPPRNVAVGLRLLDSRAAILPAEKLFEQAAVDRYDFLRDAYLQRRRSLIFDGNPPVERDREFDDDPDAVDPAPPAKDKTSASSPAPLRSGGDANNLLPVRTQPATAPSARVIRMF